MSGSKPTATAGFWQTMISRVDPGLFAIYQLECRDSLIPHSAPIRTTSITNSTSLFSRQVEAAPSSCKSQPLGANRQAITFLAAVAAFRCVHNLDDSGPVEPAAAEEAGRGWAHRHDRNTMATDLEQTEREFRLVTYC